MKNDKGCLKRSVNGKFAPNWEGPFRINKSLNNNAFRLEHLDDKQIPRTWNADHLNFYVS